MQKAAYSLHRSSFLGLPFGFLNLKLVKPKKGTTMETVGRIRVWRVQGLGQQNSQLGANDGTVVRRSPKTQQQYKAIQPYCFCSVQFWNSTLQAKTVFA